MTGSNPTRREPTYDELRNAGTSYVVSAFLVLLTGAWIFVFNLFMPLGRAVVLGVALVFVTCVCCVLHTAWKAARS